MVKSLAGELGVVGVIDQKHRRESLPEIGGQPQPAVEFGGVLRAKLEAHGPGFVALLLLFLFDNGAEVAGRRRRMAKQILFDQVGQLLSPRRPFGCGEAAGLAMRVQIEQILRVRDGRQLVEIGRQTVEGLEPLVEVAAGREDLAELLKLAEALVLRGGVNQAGEQQHEHGEQALSGDGLHVESAVNHPRARKARCGEPARPATGWPHGRPKRILRRGRPGT